MPDYKSFQVYSKPPDPQKELAWLSDMQARSRAAGGWSEYGAGEFVVTRCAIPLPYAVLGDSRWTQINAGESVVIIREAEPRGRLSEPPTYICEYRGIEINIRADRLSPGS